MEPDFDRIALLPPSGFDHNAYYHEVLLRSLPARMDAALDLGCGKGKFSRILAARASHVTALDMSANMIAVARRESAAFRNIEFLEADALAWDWPTERFDAIVSIATLHHLPLEILPKMKSALRPGGTLAVLDLRRTSFAVSAVAFGVSVLLRLVHSGRLREPAEVRRVWEEHGKTDRYLSVTEVKQSTRAILPGATIRAHLLWRYSLVWRKP